MSSARRSLDPLVGTEEFDLIAGLGAEMPMRVIGMLFGIPEEDQEAVRQSSDARLRTEAGTPMEVDTHPTFGSEMFAEYIDWRIEHPSDDLMTELLHTEFEDETGTTRTLTRDEALLYTTVVAGAGNETTHASDRLGGQGARRTPRPTPRARRGSVADPERDRGAAALRVTRSTDRALRARDGGGARRDRACGKRPALPRGGGEPRRPTL